MGAMAAAMVRASMPGRRAGEVCATNEVMPMNSTAAIMLTNVTAVAIRCDSVSCQRRRERARLTLGPSRMRR